MISLQVHLPRTMKIHLAQVLQRRMVILRRLIEEDGDEEVLLRKDTYFKEPRHNSFLIK